MSFLEGRMSLSHGQSILFVGTALPISKRIGSCPSARSAYLFSLSSAQGPSFVLVYISYIVAVKNEHAQPKTVLFHLRS